MYYLYHVLLFRPIFNLLIFLYNTLPYHDIGLAIILLTIIIKLVLYPLTKKSLQSQKAMQDLQPKVEALKAQYKDDKEKLAQELMNLYKAQKVNPLSSCLPLLIQIPFLIAVYQVFRSGLASTSFEELYGFVSNPGQINTMFLNILDLGKPQWLLAGLAGVAQFFQARAMTQKQPPKNLANKEGAKDETMLAIMNKQMLYMMPLMTVFIGISLPGGLTLYWLVMTVLTIIQQTYFLKNSHK